MNQYIDNENSLVVIIKDQTERTLWSLHNVIDVIPDSLWDKEYCTMPLWKHVYHTLHSLDQWYINPYVYEEPDFHKPDMGNLDIQTNDRLTRDCIICYEDQVSNKIRKYLEDITDNQLLDKPENCQYSKFQLIMAQHRHLDMHIGMLMGYVIAQEGLWPRVMGLKSEFPHGDYEKYF